VADFQEVKELVNRLTAPDFDPASLTAQQLKEYSDKFDGVFAAGIEDFIHSMEFHPEHDQ
jgi:hypothetical protein